MKVTKDLGAETKMGNNKIDIFDNLYRNFTPQENTINIEEKHSSFFVKYTILRGSWLSLEKLHGDTFQFPERDKWFLRITIGGDDPVTLTSENDEIDKFKETIFERVKYFDADDGLIKLELSITKILQDSTISIYMYNEF